MLFVTQVSFFFHESLYFGRSVKNFPVDHIVFDQFFLAVARQCSFRNVQQSAQVIIVEQCITVETLFRAAHPQEGVIDDIETLHYFGEHRLCGQSVCIHKLVVFRSKYPSFADVKQGQARVPTLVFLRETALMYERSVAVRFFEQGLFHLVDEIRSLYFPFQNVRSYLIGSGQLYLQESFEVRDDACE